MLEPKKNRLDYGAQLKPPNGYELDYAITTTYSLDLEAILIIPVALFFSGDLDIDQLEMRDDILESLTNVSKHISIYCQRGKIKPTDTYNFLMAYWEKSIHQIHLPRFDQSFHPKIWIIRYIPFDKELAVQYRFINTSRNLTFSRDWDMAITTEGLVGKNTGNTNQEIIDMLHYLSKNGGKKVPKIFFDELPKVQFDTPMYFDSINFHSIGIPNSITGMQYQNTIINSNKKVDTRLVMSPFLDDETLIKLKINSRNMMLFSSEIALSNIKLNTLELMSNSYMFNSFIEEAEKMDYLSEPGVEPMSQNLHAKFYIDKSGGNISWFIGSANATKPADDRNIEFMVELTTSKYAFSPLKMEEQFTAPEGNGINLFEEYQYYESPDIEQERNKEQEIRKLIHSLSGIYITGEAINNQAGLFDLKIEIPATKIKIPETFVVKVKPLPEKLKSAIELDLSIKTTIEDFTGYEETALSPFLLFEVWYEEKLEKRFVLDMKIQLSDDRFNKIFSSIINNRSRFLSYLSFLLSEDIPAIQNGNKHTANNRKSFGNGSSIAFFDGTPVYEKLLLAASRYPSRLKRIDGLIKRLKGEQEIGGNEIVTKDFESMWAVFNQFIKHKN